MLFRPSGAPRRSAECYGSREREPHDLCAAVDLRLGLIGFEVSGETYAKDLDGDPAPPRAVGYLIPDTGGLRYLPATR
ncbi:hypothetical protein Pa4123_51090 [Phytohabitans aurantiacus]|uniref:Glyoxalase-like domain-containing protein n=1 Tax=Phytohabitans aurantiacus TaxID=3016789 RepID=A0ABQ5R0L6_9ACTN|nr:hypothetical protein Pa4123_51090 [Phytohabitans aurantiacus]